MGAVEDDWGVGRGRHFGQAPEIDDQRVVPERDTTLRHEDPLVAGATHLLDRVFHIPRRQKLPLLDVDRDPCLTGGEQQVGLPRQESGNLQHIHHLGDRGALGGIMDIGQDGHAELLLEWSPERRVRPAFPYRETILLMYGSPCRSWP
jgi:hypothetical protein